MRDVRARRAGGQAPSVRRPRRFARGGTSSARADAPIAARRASRDVVVARDGGHGGLDDAARRPAAARVDAGRPAGARSPTRVLRRRLVVESSGTRAAIRRRRVDDAERAAAAAGEAFQGAADLRTSAQTTAKDARAAAPSAQLTRAERRLLRAGGAEGGAAADGGGRRAEHAAAKSRRRLGGRQQKARRAARSGARLRRAKMVGHVAETRRGQGSVGGCAREQHGRAPAEEFDRPLAQADHVSMNVRSRRRRANIKRREKTKRASKYTDRSTRETRRRAPRGFARRAALRGRHRLRRARAVRGAAAHAQEGGRAFEGSADDSSSTSTSPRARPDADCERTPSLRRGAMSVSMKRACLRSSNAPRAHVRGARERRTRRDHACRGASAASQCTVLPRRRRLCARRTHHRPGVRAEAEKIEKAGRSTAERGTNRGRRRRRDVRALAPRGRDSKEARDPPPEPGPRRADPRRRHKTGVSLYAHTPPVRDPVSRCVQTPAPEPCYAGKRRKCFGRSHVCSPNGAVVGGAAEAPRRASVARGIGPCGTRRAEFGTSACSWTRWRSTSSELPAVAFGGFGGEGWRPTTASTAAAALNVARSPLAEEPPTRAGLRGVRRPSAIAPRGCTPDRCPKNLKYDSSPRRGAR